MARTRQARDSQSDTGTQQDANHPGSARSSEELRPRGDGSSISETKINNNRNSQEATASSNRSSYRAEQDFQVSNRSSSFKAENQGHHQGYNSQNDRSRRNHDPPRYRHVSHHGHGSNRHYEGSRRSYDSQGFRRGGSQRNHDPRRDRAYYDSRDHRNRYGGDERGDRRRPRDERGTRFHYDKDDRGERYRESRKRNERAENDIRDSPPNHRGPSKRPKVEDELVELESEARKKRLELEMIQDEIKIQEGKQKLSALKSQSGVQVGETAVAAVAVREASVTSVSNSRGDAAAATDTVTLESDDDLFSTASDEDLTSRANDPVDVDEDYEPNVGEISATKKSRPKAKREEVVGPYEDYKPSGESRAAGKRGAKKKPRRKSTKTKKKKEDNQSDGYSEKSLMSRYIPTIIDHSLVCGKFLVRWDKSDGSFTESPCTSWLDIESFVFPSLAKEYLIRVTKEKTCDDDKSALMKLARKFEKVETDEKDSNMIRGLDEDEGLDLAEIDFCCFACNCSPTNNVTFRQCNYGRKYHRMCCHNYKDTDDLEGFVSAASRAQMIFLGLEEPEESEAPKSTDTDDVRAKPSAVEVQIGNSIHELEKRQHPAVILSINTGVGSVAIALKKLGISTKSIIHVEDDPVTRHVIRYHHDVRFGETNDDDGIEHIVGLYDDIAMKDPKDTIAEDMIKRFGRIDLIVCSSKGQTEPEHHNYTKQLFKLCESIKRKQHKSLLYLIESPCHNCTEEQCSCTCDSRLGNDCKRKIVCNWSLAKEVSSLKEQGASVDLAEAETTLGMPRQCTSSSVTSLFQELKKAYTVGFLGARWSEEVHPKYWNYHSLGPQGHNFRIDKSNPDASPLDAMMLEVREPTSFELLNDAEYAEVLLKRSMSVRWLVAILRPLVACFQHKFYTGYTDLDMITESDNNDRVRADNVGSEEGAYSDATEDDLNNVLGGDEPLVFDI